MLLHKMDFADRKCAMLYVCKTETTHYCVFIINNNNSLVIVVSDRRNKLCEVITIKQQ